MKTIKIKGWCIFNKDDKKPDIDNVSFEKTIAAAIRHWGNDKSQKIAKCKVIIYLEEDSNET